MKRTRSCLLQAIGYGFVAVTFSLQSLMKWTCDRLKGWRRILAADLFLVFSFIGTINVWRGIWQLLDIYAITGNRSRVPLLCARSTLNGFCTLPDDRMTGDLISHLGSFIVLALLNCSNTVLVRGVYIDAEEPEGQCVIFPIYYIRLFFQKERSRKQKRVLESVEKGEHNAFLFEKNSAMTPTIVKSSAKSVEMTAMLNNRNESDAKENHVISEKEHIDVE